MKTAAKWGIPKPAPVGNESVRQKTKGDTSKSTRKGDPFKRQEQNAESSSAAAAGENQTLEDEQGFEPEQGPDEDVALQMQQLSLDEPQWEYVTAWYGDKKTIYIRDPQNGRKKKTPRDSWTQDVANGEACWVFHSKSLGRVFYCLTIEYDEPIDEAYEPGT